MSTSPPPPAGVPPPYSYSNPNAIGSSVSLAVITTTTPEPTLAPAASTSNAPSTSTSTSQQQWFSFEGNPTDDVDAFIQSIKRHAFAQGKQRDDAWLVDYCETSLKGEALRWFLELDENVTRSWKAVQLAMLERFGNSHQHIGSPSVGLERRGSLRSPRMDSTASPPPITMPVQRFSASLPTQPQHITPGRVRAGYLQVVNDVTWASLGYVAAHLTGGRFAAAGSSSSAQALSVEIVESEKMHDMRLLNVRSEHGFFGLTMFSKNCPVSETSNGPVYPSATEHSIRPMKLPNSYNANSPCASAVWKVQPNGLLKAFWYTKSGTLVELGCCGYSPPKGGSTAQLLTFLPDPGKFLEANPAWVEVVLVFQDRA